MLQTTNNPHTQNSGSLSNQKPATKNQTMAATKTYTCSMHPEVISDKPGKCPKCGMELIERK